MQIAAHDVSRLSRLIAGCAGIAVAVLGALPLLTSPDSPSPAVALFPAGLALVLAAPRATGRLIRLPARLLALVTAALGGLALPVHPAAGAGTLLAGLAIALLDVRVPGRPGGTARSPVADPLLAGAAVIALAALVPRGPDSLITPYVAAALLTLAVGGILARQEVASGDIADRTRSEVELSRHAAEVMRSNEQLREANARLETALAFKNDLTSMLTHDVAQPISSIASLSELLTADWADLPDDIRLELATKIDRNTHRLIKMMSDLHLLFRLDTGSVTARRTPVPLLEVVRGVAGEAPDEDVEVAVGEDVSALADRGHLTVVVRNLLTNALAYGEPPVQIRAERHHHRVRLVVQDRGPGIPEDLVPKLFDRFMRGAGLGLFIVRHLVEANGGAVRYERADPHGARLIVTLESASVPGAAG